MISRISLFALCFVFLLSCTKGSRDLASIFEEGRVFEIPNGLMVHEYTLKSNGLRVLLVPNDRAPVFSYAINVDVGSTDEAMHSESGRTGLAHFFEHMMFRGTKTYPDFPSIGIQNGAVGVNAYTSKDNTVYIGSLPKEKLEFILSMEVDRFQNLPIPKKKI